MYEVESSFGISVNDLDITTSIDFTGGLGTINTQIYDHTIGFPMTICFWSKRLSNGNMWIFDQRDGSNNISGIFAQYLDSINSMLGLYSNAGTFLYKGRAILGGTNNVWTHYYIEFTSSTSIRFSMNNDTLVEGGFTTGTPTTIGSYVTTILGRFGIAKIYDLRVFQEALDTDQRTTIFNRNQLIGTEKLLLGNASGTTWSDESGNGHNAALTGSYTIDTDIPT